MSSAYTAPSAREALARASMLLCIGERTADRHLPGSMTCDTCNRRWAAMMNELSRSSADPTWTLGSISRMWSDGHRPSPSCSSCEACWMELDEASRGLVLAHCGAHPYVGWGPAHVPVRGGRGHCGDCSEWLTARDKASLRLHEAGFDPDHWVAPRERAGHRVRRR